MITKIDNTIKYGKQHGGFGIQILYPGLIRPQLHDTGFSTIGRIDHAYITPGTVIPMHPHKEDEILTYLRSGKVNHLDSEGHTAILSNQKLMMMNAGSKFSHEERVLEEGGILQGMQIFIRPEVSNLPPQVQFYDLPEIYSVNQWRKIAGSGADYPLQIRSSTWLLDLRLEAGKEIHLPQSPCENVVFLFYVFDGKVTIEDHLILNSGESALIEEDSPTFRATETTDIVLFSTKTDALHFDGGMYIGNLQ
ncbi:pimeloyl-CoA dehydrogenase [Flavobacterium magnum]|uniref:Pimeloyl-CoA dehydrogenase n=1 Tax=Flavobacterium magnum TaxID=2162713 RepID=A0A2S0RI58_9FLAO|nr:pirin family protein [Flavobacterium magnum]AWA31413.1 pimeloyl-CoA dehydrogenase [Flavobacterium magnum]